MAKKKPTKISSWYKLKDGKYPITFDSLKYGANFSEILEKIEDIKTRFGAEYEDFKFEMEEVSDYYDDSYTEVYVYGYRAETDEEFENRINQVKEMADAVREKELKLLENLKKKYEK